MLQSDIECLKRTSTATLTTQLFKRGFHNVFMQGVRALAAYGENLVGPAFTLRYIPSREDIDRYGVKPDANELQREALEAAPPGSVLVMDCRGDARAAAGGEVYMHRLRVRGVAGVVSDGGIRDSAAIAAMAYPVFCAGPSAPVNKVIHHPLEYGRPIACGGVAVYPGDIVVADGDGVVVIPVHLAHEVAEAAAEQEAMEAFVVERVKEGRPLAGFYPVSDATREAYRAWITNQASAQ